jgi:hypothetical protein
MDNESYRRGQALGFTVAELFTLLLFLVLFILAAAEHHEKRASRAVLERLHKVQNELGATKQKAAALAEKDKRLREYFGVADNFGDDFKDLVRPKEGLSDPQRQQALQEKAAAADKIHRILNAGASPTRNTGEGSEYDPKSLPRQVKSCIDEKQALQGEKQGLQGQLANVEKRYGGAGTVFPSCWVTATGGTEFVFNVDLLSGPDGGRLVIHDTGVPGHDEEKARLFNGVQFNQPLTYSDFFDETRPFYDFGTQQQPQCRFFVRVSDQTAPQDKSTFKSLLLTTQKNFYTAWGGRN